MRMGWKGRGTATLTFACLAGVCAAQELPSSLEPLRNGPLTVWMVGTVRAPRTNLQAINDLHHATPLTYQEQTSGSFGQTASTFGQNSGSYGVPSDSPSIATPKEASGQNAPASSGNGTAYHQQTSGSFGQTASSAGTNAGGYGQTSGSFGQTAGSYGTNAGGYGTAASNAGTNASNAGTNASNAGQGAASSNGPSTGNATRPASRALIEFSNAVRESFPQLQLRVVDVYPDELKDRLAAAQGTGNYPDVLVGDVPDGWGVEMLSRMLIDTLQPAAVYEDGLGEARGSPRIAGAVTVVQRAPHRDAARALELWVNEAESGCAGCVLSEAERKQPYVGVAVSAVDGLLHGLPLADLADPDLAAFPVTLGRSMLTTVTNTLVDGGAANVEVLRASRNGRLAAVSLRVVAASDRVYGVAHPLVVLRQAKNGEWKVLHVSLNLPASDEERVRRALMNTSPTSVVEQSAGVVGVSLTVPAEGDTRSPMPELGWDNGGGAGLQVVEWQQAWPANTDGWSDARLYLVGDEGVRLKTQVTAEFAIYQTRYRWRVWSVGAGGQTKISSWRTMNIVP
jgi:hypothetical protein